MSVTVQIPTQLRQFVGGATEVQAEGANVRELLERLGHSHPDFRTRLFDDTGAIRRFVNIYVNDEDVRFLQGPDTAVTEADRVVILPAVAGG